MRNLDDQHLDEFFRNDLEPDYDKFDEANWSKMEERLNGIVPKVNQLPLINLAQYAAMIIMVAISGFAAWQTYEGRMAISTLSHEVEELKKSQQVEEVVIQAATPNQVEPQTTEQVSFMVTEQKTEPVEKPVVKENTEVATAKEEKETTQPIVDETTTKEEPMRASKEKEVTAKYYMLVDGEFVPVAEFDHPGAEQGDSVRANGDLSQQASN